MTPTQPPIVSSNRIISQKLWEEQLQATFGPDLERLRRRLEISGLSHPEHQRPQASIRITNLTRDKMSQMLKQHLVAKQSPTHWQAASQPLNVESIHEWVEQYCNLWTSNREACIRGYALSAYYRRAKQQVEGQINEESFSFEMLIKYEGLRDRMSELERDVLASRVAVMECLRWEYVCEWFDDMEGIARFEWLMDKFRGALEMFAAAFDEVGIDPDDGGDGGYWMKVDSCVSRSGGGWEVLDPFMGLKVGD